MGVNKQLPISFNFIVGKFTVRQFLSKLPLHATYACMFSVLINAAQESLASQTGQKKCIAFP